MLASLIPIIGGIIDKVIPDPKQKMELHLELAKLADKENEREHEEMIAQSSVNQIEASHRSVFVAGWRPAIGWGCGAALVYNTLLAPMFGLGQADLGFLQTVLMGMLGIGGMRTVEKLNGVTNDVLPIFKTNEKVASAPQDRKKPRILPFDIPGIKGI